MKIARKIKTSVRLLSPGSSVTQRSGAAGDCPLPLRARRGSWSLPAACCAFRQAAARQASALLLDTATSEASPVRLLVVWAADWQPAQPRCALRNVQPCGRCSVACAGSFVRVTGGVPGARRMGAATVVV